MRFQTYAPFSEPDTSRAAADRCIALGCPNPVVRVFVNKDNRNVRFGVCQFHGERAMKSMTDEQLRRYVFPTLVAEP